MFVIFKQTFSYFLYYLIIPVAYCVDDSLDLELSEAGWPPLGGQVPPISCGKRGGLIQAMVAPGGSGTGSSRGGSYRSPASRWGGPIPSSLGLTAAEAATGDSPK